jgi:hypothetical protein
MIDHDQAIVVSLRVQDALPVTHVAMTSSTSAVPCKSVPPDTLSSTQHLATPKGLSVGDCRK